MLNPMFIENFLNNVQINTITKFNLNNCFQLYSLFKIVLMFVFYTIKYNKKKILIFFLIMEMLTGQSASVILAKKPALHLKLIKGSIVGCKVTLRKSRIFDFIENLYLALPRLENFKGILFKKLNNKEFSFHINELYIFYSIEFHINIFIQNLNLNLLFNSSIKEVKSYALNPQGVITKLI